MFWLMQTRRTDGHSRNPSTGDFHRTRCNSRNPSPECNGPASRSDSKHKIRIEKQTVIAEELIHR